MERDATLGEDGVPFQTSDRKADHETRLPVPRRSMGTLGALYGLRADGEEFPIEASISQIEANGRKLYTVILRDITERKRADEALKEQARILDLAPVVIRDLSGRIVFWNAGAEQMYGWKTGEALDKLIHTLLQTQFPRPVEEIKARLYAHNHWEGELVHTRKDGERIVVASHWVLHRDEQDKPKAVLEINNDITERKQGEKEIRRLNEELQDNLARLVPAIQRETNEAANRRARRQAEDQLRLQSAALEAAANGIVITDTRGKIIWINPAFTQSTGYSQEEVLGQNPRLLKSGKQSDSFYRDMWETILAGQVWCNTIVNRRKDGTLNREDMTITPIRNAGEKITHFVAIKQDITQLENALSEVNQKREELAAMTQQLWQASKLATMGELAAGVAHELNNPLATISLHLEVLTGQLSADAPNCRPLQVIEHEVERMAVLVSNLLLFSRRSHQQISTINMAEELQSSLEFIHYHLRSRGITVVTDFANDLPSVQADRQQLRQVFLNLLTNASDAMPEGGTMTIRAGRATLANVPRALLIEFSDTGIGIEPEDMPKLWEPFFTTKPEGKGTGLGLPICRRTVEEHRGTIDIESLPGKGTTVRIILPATEMEIEKRD